MSTTITVQTNNQQQEQGAGLPTKIVCKICNKDLTKGFTTKHIVWQYNQKREIWRRHKADEALFHVGNHFFAGNPENLDQYLEVTY